jgi:hypothetical protein
MVTELALEIKQIGFEVNLEPELVDGVPLIAAADTILSPEGLERVEVGCHEGGGGGQPRWLPAASCQGRDHEPPRTARTQLLLLLLLLFTLPSLKFTFHALFGLFW